MPKASPHPYVTWRDGRPRFTPSPTLRKQGHDPKDLKREDGSWFSLGEAIDWSRAFQKQLAEEKAAAAKAKKAHRKSPAAVAPVNPYSQAGFHLRAQRANKYGITVGQIYHDWQHPVHGSVRFRQEQAKPQIAAILNGRRKRAPTQEKAAYSPRTIRDIKQKIGLLELDHPDIWASPVDALTQPIMFSLYEEMVASRGLAQARSIVAWLSVIFSWARKRGKCQFLMNQGQNPAKGLGMATPQPRVRFGTRAEINALIAAADKLEMSEIGDMIVLGVWTGQRQADRLQLVDKGSLNGRRFFRQAKTGAIVDVPESPELVARLAASLERRKAAGVVSPHVILNEQTWQPYGDDGDRYRKRFAQVRAAAAKFCPSLMGKGREDNTPFFEMDLRDTSVTWLALAGATVPEICSVTGHTLDSATRILRHYLAQHPKMADAAISKMIEWYDSNGETEIGV